MPHQVGLLGQAARLRMTEKNRMALRVKQMSWVYKGVRPYGWTPQTKFAIPLGSYPPSGTTGFA
jgi:hypothetical protein